MYFLVTLHTSELKYYLLNLYIFKISYTFCSFFDLIATLDLSKTQQLIGALTILRRAGSLGADVQTIIASRSDLLQVIQPILLECPADQHDQTLTVVKLCWQFLANLCVNNATSQQLVWTAHGQTFLECLRIAGHSNRYICRMIIYQMQLNNVIDTTSNKVVLSALLENLNEQIAKPTETICEFLQFTLEHFCCNHQNFLPIYGALSDSERIVFLHFVSEYLRSPLPIDGQRTPISRDLTQYICKEFKKKSDCVLKTQASYVDSIHPREVCALLEVICLVSGDDYYSHILSTDSSLFLNAGCLLMSINRLGGQSENIFTPVSKLGQVAPNSTEETSIERDVSFELKSMLVRTIGNLVYHNARNQELARDMDILLAVLNCTNVDARNPLIKEWGVLAIRNLCWQCPENQELIRQLTKIGDADNSNLVKEFNLDLGSMRIG